MDENVFGFSFVTVKLQKLVQIKFNQILSFIFVIDDDFYWTNLGHMVA